MSLGNTEKDYVLSVALVKLAELPESKKMVFKGGTCLKKAHFPDYRFSADLDFTGSEDVKARLKGTITRLFQEGEIEGVKFLKVLDRTQKVGRRLNLAIQYSSRVAASAGREHVDSIRMDCNFEGGVFTKPNIKRLAFPKEYGLGEPVLPVMQLKEIMSENIHAVYRRPKPRDLYDVWFLLKKEVELDVRLVNEKLKALNKKFDPITFQERLALLRQKWDRDMGGLMSAYPNFNEVEKEVVGMIQGRTKNVQFPERKIAMGVLN